MRRALGNVRLHIGCLSAFALAAILFFAPAALADRTKLKPGMNSFSPQEDIEMGRQGATQAEEKYPLCSAPEVDAYLSKLGKRLVAHLNTNGVEYPWEFHCVNDKSINAFALPGGFVFVNRGAFEAADNEAQLAGVMAHELSHVALRHGTNQLTKLRYSQLGTGILGAAGEILGGTPGAAAAGLGNLAMAGVLLRYSRGAETQADVMGTQVLYDAGYDPRALADFFDKLNSNSAGGKAPPDFFSDHPNPDHRVERVDEEIRNLGGAPENAQKDSPEFQAIKKEVQALRIVEKPKTPGANASSSAAPAPGAIRVGPPSATYTSLALPYASFNYPDNWKKYGQGNDVSLAPDGGIVSSGGGPPSLAYGVSAGVAPTQGRPPADTDELTLATQKLIEAMQKTNPNMQIAREPKTVTLNGERALSTFLRNDSPMGGEETDWLVTVLRSEGLVYFICAAPQPEFDNFDGAFRAILDSVRFPK
jgi:beta-barrel assembly-enhancing protease